MRNDPDNGLIAGRCKCKENVAGARCQRCEAGYWDLSMDGCRGKCYSKWYVYSLLH